MLNGKEIKCVKDMVLTGTPEFPVYSGGSVTFHNTVQDDRKLQDAVQTFLQVLNDYPEPLVPVNRDSAVVRALRFALGSTER